MPDMLIFNFPLYHIIDAVTIAEGLDKYIWQFEQTDLHSGNWSRVSVKPDIPFYGMLYFTIGKNPWNLPHFASADSKGIARIMSRKFSTEEEEDKLLRYEEWSFINQTLSNRHFREHAIINSQGFCTDGCFVLY